MFWQLTVTFLDFRVFAACVPLLFPIIVDSQKYVRWVRLAQTLKYRYVMDENVCVCTIPTHSHCNDGQYVWLTHWVLMGEWLCRALTWQIRGTTQSADIWDGINAVPVDPRSSKSHCKISEEKIQFRARCNGPKTPAPWLCVCLWCAKLTTLRGLHPKTPAREID